MSWSRIFTIYTGGFVLFVAALAVGEQLGMPQRWIGWTFIIATIAIYATIGILSRTGDVTDYYVAGRRVPAIFNGMATGSDWMSAASFIGMAGTIYALGYDGLAYILGWTGGYVLLAVFLAPYLRKFGEYTIPDFLGARYGGNTARTIGLFCAILVSFTYLIAQITGVGIIMSRFLGMPFQIGVFVGLGGILVCSVLGGMRAITWTQVAQYIILIIAYLAPVVVMSYRTTANPVPQLAYGKVLAAMEEREKELADDPAEEHVRRVLAAEAASLRADAEIATASWKVRRMELHSEMARASDAEKALLEQQLASYPASPEIARETWLAEAAAIEKQLAPPKPFLQLPKGKELANFVALIFCLMIGTAGLPHVLMRYYTTPTVREARSSVGWSIFFIAILYVTAPAYAVFARHEVLTRLVGSSFADLPGWIARWATVGLVQVRDWNLDGIVQKAEVLLQPDAIVLATPEIAGLPFVIAGLVVAGGLAAALSTADGLLLTISNALSHDLYFRQMRPDASAARRLAVSRVLLIVTALFAAWVATFRVSIIVEIVAWAFSIAASVFFPALVLGIWWRRTSKSGAIAGMLTGLVVCVGYMIANRFFGIEIFGIRSIAAATFGLPASVLATVLVSLATEPPDESMQEFLTTIRDPRSLAVDEVVPSDKA